jgi:dTDP-4-dehydrorhamnose reductase
MLGSAAYQCLSNRFPGSVYAAARSPAVKKIFPASAANITIGIDVENTDALAGFLQEVRPDVIVNCVGVVKQLSSAANPLVAIPINAILPHRLARLADLLGARLIHVSTDCVFSGRKGDYRESDIPDAEDLYGRSKLLGEVDYPNAVTLRTSIIGRELGSCNGLVEWFLSQRGSVRGYRRAIFSGLTTDELVRVIADRILPNPNLRGVYHVSVAPISKFDLLGIVRDVYGVETEIEPDDAVAIDRSLNSDRFRKATGYAPPSWPELIHCMRRFDEESFLQVR